MKFCMGAWPQPALPSTRHRIKTLAGALALVLLAANGAAGSSVVVEPRQTFVAAASSYPAPSADGAPCDNSYVEAGSVERVSTVWARM